MVTDLEELPHNGKNGNGRYLIAEIVGPAGAGKTTLLHALETYPLIIKKGTLPPVWHPRYIPFFVKNISLLVPTLVNMQGKGDRRITRRELAWMAMLLGWPKVLKTEGEREKKAILLDQGPVFLMAILSEFGPASLQTPVARRYWNDITGQWVHTLNMVIWLDAPDPILIERIRTRKEDHQIKNKTDQEIKAFLEKYRAAYERLICTTLRNNGDIRVLRFDTHQNSVDELVHSILRNIPCEDREQDWVR